MWNRLRMRVGSGALLMVLAAAPCALRAQTVTLFGTPSNFDVLNDTGQDVHGFEVELQGIAPGNLGGVWSFRDRKSVV